MDHVACTSVITEITYHTSPSEADVVFISKESWKEELWRFLGDIKDDLNDPARNASSSVHNPPKLQLRSTEGKQAWKTVSSSTSPSAMFSACFYLDEDNLSST